MNRFSIVLILLFIPGLIFAQANSYEIPFRKQAGSGLLYVDVVVNGVQRAFIFDTGASTISINSGLFRQLKNSGKISSSDIVSVVNVVIANGNSIPANIVRLHTVTFGDFTMNNVNAIVMPDQNAPLLIGQSFFSNFETVSIDYVNSTIKLQKLRTQSVAQSKLREIRFIPCSIDLKDEPSYLIESLKSQIESDRFSEETNVPPPAKAVDKVKAGITVRYFDNDDYSQAALIAEKLRGNDIQFPVHLENMLPFFNYKPIPGYIEVWMK